MKMKLIDGKRNERQEAEKLLKKRKATRFLVQVIAHTNRVVAAGKDFDEADEDDLVFILTGAVKFFAFLEGEELDGETDKELRALWQMYDSMIALAACLSPAKIAQLFPAEKEYNGAKYDMKDYFTSVAAVEQAGGWKKFKDEDAVLSFLMDLNNDDITRCCIASMHIIDAMGARRGQKSLIETFLEKETGMPVSLPKHLGEARDKAGNVYITADGEVLGLKAKPRRPKWLRTVNGYKG